MATVKKARTKKTSNSNDEATSLRSVSSVPSVEARSVDLQDAIRVRAYELYQQRGGRDGADLEDWVRAEKELLETFRGRTA